MPTNRSARTRRSTVLVATLGLLAALLQPVLWDVAPAQAAEPCTDPAANAVACENSLPGIPASEWEVSGSGDPSLQGFATQMSVNVGETVTFKVLTSAPAYYVDILRLGHYQGLGARKVAAQLRPTSPLPQEQPACLQFPDTGLIDCGNWAASASWSVPANAVSGVYIARLVRDDNGGGSLIPFVVRNDAGKSKIAVQTSDSTWQAYNNYGGNSLYHCTVACPPGNPATYKGAFKVSYNRPFNPPAMGPNWLFDAEYPMIRFLEANGYDVSYLSGLDTAIRGNLLLNHKVFMSSGHDEYWSGDQRANVEAARDAGVNLAFFSGNEMFWKTRWEPSADGSATANRTLVTYKDTLFSSPVDPVEWTGTWRDPRFGDASVGKPENALTGQFFLVNAGSTDIKVPAEFGPMRLWRNTAAATLTGSQSLTLGEGLNTLGYEWDIDADNGFRPPGTFKLSSTTHTAPEVFTDYGSQIAPATVTHNLTSYRAPSGALVFGAGTIQWAYGLDGYVTGKDPDRNMQQATVNLLADMDAQPVTLMPGLTVATKSTDTTRPSSQISAGLAGQTVADGAKVTISGTASDAGGRVAGVEISTDGGKTWHPAQGRNNWTYSWIAHGSPVANIKTRAVDDSGNLEVAGAGANVNVSCPCSIWGPNVTPAIPDSGDTGSVEVGLKFSSEVTGTVTGVRFYKSAANTGTHTGNLWNAAGQLLATATFTNETLSGWQTVAFSTPVAIAANTTYVVSYFAPQGHYAQSPGHMYPNPSPMPAGGESVDSAPLHAQRSTPTSGNGVYAYGGGSSFPVNSYNAENYWVDVTFVPDGTAVAPIVTTTTPANGATAAAVTTAPTATFSQAVTPASVTFSLKGPNNTPVAGTTSHNSSTNTATFTPAAALSYATTYTATVSGATNATGQSMAAPHTWSFTTAPVPPAPTVASTTPTNGATAVATTTSPTATFSQPVTAASVIFTLKGQNSTTVPGTTSYNSATNTSTFTPNAALSQNTQYTATVSGATNATGQAMAAPYTWTFTTASTPPAAGSFSALAPFRQLDSRDGTGDITGPVAPGATIRVQVTGRGGIPATGVSAVAVNVTATQGQDGGFITAYASGSPRPGTSNLNYRPGQDIPNLVITPVGTDGKIALTNTSPGTVHLVADTFGYYISGTPTVPGAFSALAPFRQLDSRNGTGDITGPVAPGATIRVQVTGRGGIPATGVSAVAVNVTATQGQDGGFITAYASGSPRPGTSNLNYRPGQDIPNLVITPVGTDGKIALTNTSPGTVHLVADTFGYYISGTPTVPGAFSALAPFRQLDSRNGTGDITGPVAPGATIRVQVTGRGGIPATGVSAVAVNVTATQGQDGGFITAYASGSPRPGTSNLNYRPGQDIPNLVITPVGTDGKIALTNTSPGTVHLVADTFGYYLSGQ
ncbi:N,N-dimethylformamidase beta subunit family domain-containing protein [Arthrobacter sp. B6]|uniref:N,N-dimethylformamidase beta subunit family domain-containing protein n=1 Tax=Arthrobacter sp. B6 TaxID=1570137 RepID=UPI000834E5E4|nr:N,N-dimethylformamidase beta subunit family domain-containing protein [Arthrobacter sp. B6]